MKAKTKKIATRSLKPLVAEDTAIKKVSFLEHMKLTLCNVTHAAKEAGITRNTAYVWRREDSKFADKWDEIHAAKIDEAERELYRRAVEGEEESIFDKNGNLVKTIRKTSDLLLIFMLKAELPEKYRELVKIAPTDPSGQQSYEGSKLNLADISAFADSIRRAVRAEDSAPATDSAKPLDTTTPDA